MNLANTDSPTKYISVYPRKSEVLGKLETCNRMEYWQWKRVKNPDAEAMKRRRCYSEIDNKIVAEGTKDLTQLRGIIQKEMC